MSTNDGDGEYVLRGVVVRKFLQDLWNNPFFWIAFAIVIVIRLILH